MHTLQTTLAATAYGTAFSSFQATTRHFSAAGLLYDSLGRPTSTYVSEKHTWFAQDALSQTLGSSERTRNSSWSVNLLATNGMVTFQPSVDSTFQRTRIGPTSCDFWSSEYPNTAASSSTSSTWAAASFSTSTATYTTTAGSNKTTARTTASTEYRSTTTVDGSATTTTATVTGTVTSSTADTEIATVTRVSTAVGTVDLAGGVVFPVVVPRSTCRAWNVTRTANSSVGSVSVLGTEVTAPSTLTSLGREFTNLPAIGVTSTNAFTNTYTAYALRTFVTTKFVASTRTRAVADGRFPSTATENVTEFLLTTATTAFVLDTTTTSRSFISFYETVTEADSTVTGATWSVSFAAKTWLSAAVPVTYNQGFTATATTTFAILYSNTTSFSSRYLSISPLSWQTTYTEGGGSFWSVGTSSSTYTQSTSYSGFSTGTFTQTEEVSSSWTFPGTSPVTSSVTASLVFAAGASTYTQYGTTVHGSSSSAWWTYNRTLTWVTDCVLTYSTVDVVSSTYLLTTPGGPTTMSVYTTLSHEPPVHTYISVTHKGTSSSSVGAVGTISRVTSATWSQTAVHGSTGSAILTLSATDTTSSATVAYATATTAETVSATVQGFFRHAYPAEVTQFGETEGTAERWPNITVLVSPRPRGFLPPGSTAVFTNLSASTTFYYPFLANGVRSSSVSTDFEGTLSTMTTANLVQLSLWPDPVTYSTGESKFTARYDPAASKLLVTSAVTTTGDQLTFLSTHDLSISGTGDPSETRFADVRWSSTFSDRPLRFGESSSQTSDAEDVSSYNGRAFSTAGPVTAYLAPGVYNFTQQRGTSTTAFTTSYGTPTFLTSSLALGVAIPDRQESIVEYVKTAGTFLSTETVVATYKWSGSVAEDAGPFYRYRTGGHGSDQHDLHGNTLTNVTSIWARPFITFSKYPTYG